MVDLLIFLPNFPVLGGMAVLYDRYFVGFNVFYIICVLVSLNFAMLRFGGGTAVPALCAIG